MAACGSRKLGRKRQLMAGKSTVEKTRDFPNTLGLTDREIQYGLDILGETLRMIRTEERAMHGKRPHVPLQETPPNRH